MAGRDENDPVIIWMVKWIAKNKYNVLKEAKRTAEIAQQSFGLRKCRSVR